MKLAKKVTGTGGNPGFFVAAKRLPGLLLAKPRSTGGVNLTHLPDLSARTPRRRLRRAVFIGWLALLAFGLPEVFAGTGRLWIVRPDAFILALPLYALHFLLLCHIAVKTRRTSWPALYLFGVIFGLYETWVTKVVWNGYPGSDGFAFGSFGPWFGIHETLGLVLFYHPVTSFLLPLAVLSRLFPAWGRAFPVPDWVFGASRAARLRRVGLVVLWGSFAGHNIPEPGAYLLTWLPMIGLLWLGYLALRRAGLTREPSVIAGPVLGRFGVILVVLWLTAMYIVTYVHLLPENLPPAPAQWLTAAFYPLLVVAIVRTPRMGRYVPAPLTTPARLPFGWLLAVFGFGFAMMILTATANPLGTALAVVAFLGLMVLGVGLFAWLVVWKGILRPGP